MFSLSELIGFQDNQAIGRCQPNW